MKAFTEKTDPEFCKKQSLTFESYLNKFKKSF